MAKLFIQRTYLSFGTRNNLEHFLTMSSEDQMLSLELTLPRLHIAGGGQCFLCLLHRANPMA